MNSVPTLANSTHPTKVLFLDIDGVLNSSDWYRRRISKDERPFDELDPEAVSRLNYLVETANTAIVIISTWRIFHTSTQIQRLLGKKGLKTPSRIIGSTPDSKRGLEGRGSEIDLWLRQAPAIESFVILDDDSDMEPHLDRLVKTEHEWGLTDSDVEKALTLFGSSCESPFSKVNHV